MLNKIKLPYLRNFSDSFAPVFASLFLIFVAVPSYVFWLNSSDISWQGSDWVYQFAVASFIAFFLVMISVMISGVICRCINVIANIAFLFVFIRCFFAPVSFGVLEGGEIIEAKIASDLSVYSSLVLILVLLFCSLKYLKLIENIVRVSILVLIPLVTFIYFTHDNSNGVADESHLSRFSKKDNIIVISFDSIQNDLLTELVSDNEKLRNTLNDFTLYTDVTSYAPNTTFSLLSTLVGSYIGAGDSGEVTKKLRRKYGNSTLPSVMAEHNYDVDTFNLPCELASNATCMNTASVLPDSVSGNYRLTAYNVGLLKVIPKSVSWRMVQSLSLNDSGDYIDEVALISADKKGHGFGMDKYTFKQMYTEMYLVDRPVFKIHHYLHSHQPIRLNSECSYDPETPQNIKAAKSAISCVLLEFNKFTQNLKKLGIFDDALIILTSDHGYESNIQPSTRGGKHYDGGLINTNGIWSASRYWPILLIKKPQEKGNLKIDNGPVSLVDIAPTIYDSAKISFCKNSQCDGVGLLGESNLKKRVRKAMFYIGGGEHIDNKHSDTRLFLSENIVGSAYTGINDAMIRASLSGQGLSCNQIVNFNEGSGSHIVDGISGVESWGRWSDSVKSRVLFKIDATKCSEGKLFLNLRGFVSSKNPNQTAKVFLNGRKIGEVIIELGDNKSQEITFNIPTNILMPESINSLEFHIADPVSPSSLGISKDTRLLGLGFESMVFR